MSLLHEGRSVVVTGSRRGIGVEIARRFAQDGADVMMNGTNDEGLADRVSEIEAEGPGQVEAIVTGVHTEDGAKKLINGAIEAFGKVDILINNAGGGVIRPFLKHDQESFNTTLERNLWTMFWCCQAALPHMMERKYGRIVGVGAESVRNGLDSHAGYNAAKGGMNGMTTGLAREFAPYGITVNVVSPGGVVTPEVREMLDPDSEVYKKHDMGGGGIQKYMEPIPMKRFAEMDEVASMVSFVAAEESRFVTGQVIGVNGGNTMY